jgi:hypothetical protein
MDWSTATAWTQWWTWFEMPSDLSPSRVYTLPHPRMYDVCEYYIAQHLHLQSSHFTRRNSWKRDESHSELDHWQFAGSRFYSETVERQMAVSWRPLPLSWEISVPKCRRYLSQLPPWAFLSHRSIGRNYKERFAASFMALSSRSRLFATPLNRGKRKWVLHFGTTSQWQCHSMFLSFA